MLTSERLRAAAATLSRRFVVGFTSGLLAGAVTGSVSSLIVRLVANRHRDDAMFDVIFGAMVGTIGGMFLQAVRDWLPEKWRGLWFGLLILVIVSLPFWGGEDRDFTLRAMLMRTLPFVVFGWMVVLFARRLERSGRFRPQALATQIIVIIVTLAGFLVLATVVAQIALSPHGNPAADVTYSFVLGFSALALAYESLRPPNGDASRAVRLAGYAALGLMALRGVILLALAIA